MKLKLLCFALVFSSWSAWADEVICQGELAYLERLSCYVAPHRQVISLTNVGRFSFNTFCIGTRFCHRFAVPPGATTRIELKENQELWLERVSNFRSIFQLQELKARISEVEI